MFRRLNMQGVESDKGFVVQCISRFSMEYREGDHRMLLGCESDAAGRLHVQTPRRHWDPPFSEQEIPDQKLEEIRENIAESLRFQNLESEFVQG
jgi:hypothetical protein